MDATAEGITVEREITIAARRETVWEFLVDPEKAVRWMGRSASFDAQPGGRYRVEVVPGNVATGTFVEVEVPSRLVFTWGWEPESDSPVSPGSTTVEIELIPVGDSTLLRLRHRGLPGAEPAAAHRRGWDHYLPRLAEAAAGGDPGLDPWIERPPE